jgi:hypothetical protein
MKDRYQRHPCKINQSLIDPSKAKLPSAAQGCVNGVPASYRALAGSL